METKSCITTLFLNLIFHFRSLYEAFLAIFFLTLPHETKYHRYILYLFMFCMYICALYIKSSTKIPRTNFCPVEKVNHECAYYVFIHSTKYWVCLPIRGLHTPSPVLLSPAR